MNRRCQRRQNRRSHRALLRAATLPATAAQKLYIRLLRRQPRLAEAWLALGQLAETAGRPARAAVHYRRAIGTGEQAGEGWFRLGLLARREGRLLAALEALQKSQCLQPERVAVYVQLAELLVALEQPQAAMRCYLQALELDPAQERVYFRLSELLDDQGDFDAVLDCLQALCLIHPELLGLVSFYLGYLLEKRGEYASALLCYDKALETRAWLPWRLKRELAAPLLMDSSREIAGFRRQLEQTLDRFLRLYLGQAQAALPEGLSQSAFDAIHLSLTQLAYHHAPLLPLRRRIAQLIGLMLAIPKREPLPATAADEIHLGVLFSAGIKLPLAYFGGLLNWLDAARFRITVFCPSPRMRQALAGPGAALDFDVLLAHPRLQICVLSPDPSRAAEQVRAAATDALFFTEPNWDALQYQLCLQRLAPVQFTSWLNPGTTGSGAMDYYLSSDLLEDESHRPNYAERLELLETLPSGFPRVRLSSPELSRADFGLPAAGALYVCPHSLLKFHPDFDALLAGILTADPQGQLVLTVFKGQDALAARLMQRFARQMPELMERIWALPYLSRPQLFELFALAGVLLDTWFYGGGTTNYQAFACGLPVVTLPSEMIVGRMTLGHYGQITRKLLAQGYAGPEASFEACIATSPEDYIAKAVRLANDSSHRAVLSERLRANAHLICDDQGPARSLSAFLLRACRGASQAPGERKEL